MDQRVRTPATSGTTDPTDVFIARWQGVTASELATAQSFVIELCDLLGVSKPHATPDQSYMFERPLKEAHGDGHHSDRRIDCYKRGHFVLESKKLKVAHHTKGYDNTLLAAHAQAQNYVRALPPAEGRPPFLVVVDVGSVIQLFSEFSRSGGNYVPFPDPRSHQIKLHDLRDEKVRERLRLLWKDPMALDLFGWASWVLRGEDEVDISADQLLELIQSINDLESKFLQTEMSPFLREFLSRQIAASRSALHIHRAQGVKSIKEALNQVFGAFASNPEEVHREMDQASASTKVCAIGPARMLLGTGALCKCLHKCVC